MMKRTDDQRDTSELVLHRTKLITFVWGACVISLAFWKVGKQGESLELNEWGDFAAGAFSPIAFVWFIAAVIMQSFELRAQRQELAMTRQEFEQNRKVLTEQAAFIKIQSDLMKEEADGLRSEQILGENISLMAYRLRQYRTAWLIRKFRRGNEQNMLTAGSFISMSEKIYDGLTDEMVIAKTAQALRNVMRKIKTQHGELFFYPEHPWDLQRMLRGVLQGIERIEALPRDYKTKSQALELTSFRASIRNLDTVIEWERPLRSLFEPFEELDTTAEFFSISSTTDAS